MVNTCKGLLISCNRFVSILSSFMYIALFSWAVIEMGNFPATSASYLDTVSKDVAVILTDFRLVNGKVIEFRITTTGRSTPTRLQLWRPLTQSTYELVADVRIVSGLQGDFSVGFTFNSVCNGVLVNAY